ncbi:FadR/GntR family transcriptional regulator [Paeniglutamicibacter cryotolerans]|uniref:DNA-binding FadR family transcriptional regulator n=1 Tax=Paeniglutamicibacter cryotolerans TaxID=670079 RepID=A0A839QV05_9MICC|nr:FadR/GntR family transcriptional regulator [Paeniglutamicibacter cryotolerans]MBB2995821.1 DNA-binding FadR family transcriptional regulator [Paeniglutamicibacter cryotolerans]
MTTNFTPAVPVRTYERVVEQIENAITSGAVAPGDHLPSERELMVQFSVSRPTIREALRVLQSMGLVESKPGGRGGPLVLEPSPASLTRSFTTMVRLDSLSMRELVQFRLVLDSAACRLAATLHTPDQLAAMGSCVERMEAAVGADTAAFARADVDFHLAVWEASGNALLSMCGQAVAGAILQLITQQLKDAADSARIEADSAALDRGIFDAIAAGNSMEAGRRARQAIYDRYSSLLPAEDAPGLDALLG